MSVVARGLKKHWLLGGLLSLLALALLITPALGAVKAAKKPRVTKVSLLYALNAGSGTLTKGKGNKYELTLKGLDRNATWFSDRPVRRTSSFPVSGLAHSWKGFGFATDPPNAALTYTNKSGNSGRTVILELSHPRYAGGKLIFSARPLDPESAKSPNLAQHAAGADRLPARSFTDASLFVDDTEAPVVDSCIIQPYTICSHWYFQDFDLSGADLEGAEMSGSVFLNGIMTGVNLTGANLGGAQWGEAGLTEAKLKEAYLSGARFRNSSLVNAELQRADISEAHFIEVDLEYANLANVIFDRETIFHESNVCHMTGSGEPFEPPCYLA